MLCIKKCDMHLFQTEEQNQPIVYQVETGLFFELDTLFQSILACCEGLSASQVVQTLADQYEAEEIVEAIEELAQVGLDFGWRSTSGVQCADDRRGGSLWGFAD